jgi:CubicO group peptidase (beta-lactamase class C family)
MLRDLTVLSLAILSLAQGAVVSSAPGRHWQQYATLEDAGFDPVALEKARGATQRSGAAAVVIAHDGHIAAAWGVTDRPFKTASIRKSVLNLMFGAPGVAKTIRLDATLADLGIDDRQPLSVRERSATVAHLLSARSGVYHPAAREPASMSRSRPGRGSALPGESWFYNNWDFNALGTIYQTFTGQDVFTGFRRTLAEPLGLEDYRPHDGFPIRELSRSRHAAYEFRLSARDLARIGHLVAENGRWNGQQLVSVDWLSESFRVRSPFPQGGGYGYLWWIDASKFRTDGKALPALEAVADVAATGLGEQLLLVVPSLKLVIAHLTDRDGGAQPESGAAFEIADLILQARRGEPRANAPLKALTTEPLPNAPAPTIDRIAVPFTGNAADFVGDYAVSPAVTAVIRYIDDGLFIDMPGRGEAEIFQEAPDRFFLKVADVVINFERDAGGAVVAARVEERGRALVAKKVR